MNSKLLILPLGASVFLASCSGGAPSNKDIERAFKNNMDQVTSLFGSDFGKDAPFSIENTNCKKQDAERYHCNFSVTVDVPMLGGQQTYEQSGVFMKRDGRWRHTY